MTNSWTDIDNTSLVLVWGANPAENHPACFAHINIARERQVAAGNTGPTLVVVDPRRTRTALQADRYIRIRPGTDIALENAVIRGIMARMENPVGGDVAKAAQFFKFLNQKSAGTFFSDGAPSGAAAGSISRTVASGVCSKYTDARFLVNAVSGDYLRGRIDYSTGTVTTGGPDNTTISNFPLKSDDCLVGDTVYNNLKAHVAPYDPATVASICGCTTDDIAYLIEILINNSRCSSVADVLATQDPRTPGYRVTSIFYAMGMTQHTYGSSQIKGFANIQTLMGNMGRAGGGINALRGIHNVQGSTDMGLLYGNIPAYSSNPTKMTSGIVSGFTNTGNDANAFGKYMDSLWGTPLAGTGNKATMNASYDDAYNTAAMALQQRGFYNMTRYWFADPDVWTTSTGRAMIDPLYDLWPKGNGDDHITMFRQMAAGGYTKALCCWGQNPAVTEPNQSAVRDGLENLDLLVVVDMYETETASCKRKDTGVTYLIPACSHVEEAGSVTNSARSLQWREKATEPKGNSKADMELLLRLAHALDNTTATSGGAFQRLKLEWDRAGYAYTSAYDSLYGRRFGWTPNAGTEFEAVEFFDDYTQTWSVGSGAPTARTSGNPLKGSEAICEKVFREAMSPVAVGGCLWIYTGAFNKGTTTSPSASPYKAWQTDNVHPSIGKQTSATDFTWTGDVWLTPNRAKSRDNRDGNIVTGTKAFGGWGYSWLVNRRVFYNNGDIPGDVADYFMGPDSVSRLFVSTNPATFNYSRWYRTIHKLTDMPDVCYPVVGTAANGTIGQQNGSKHVMPGRFPAFTEPYETPKGGDATYMALWGRNTKGTAKWDLVKATTPVAGRGYTVASGAIKDDPAVSEFPLVLTTIRCVEHFQGGPTTRNNAWNVEAEPEPWIEINPVDARNAVPPIAHGDWVNVITARSDSKADQEGRTATSGWAQGFRARVDNTISAYQRVAPGVVAIPWHWGDAGLGKGSRANDLCLDAGDANTVIPEYKACLCKIQKA